jgi:hypothetical protein
MSNFSLPFPKFSIISNKVFSIHFYLLTTMSSSPNFIELPGIEVSALTGVYLNPATGAVWELFIQDGKLLVDVPNCSFQMAPSSPTIFRPVNTLVNLEFEFEKPHPHPNHPRLMHIYAKGIRRATFEALS